MIEKLAPASAMKSEHRLVQPSLRVLNLLPGWMITIAAELLAVVAFLVDRKGVRRIQTNIHHVLGIPMGSRASRLFAYQCARHQIYVLLETVSFCMRPSQIKFKGLTEFQALIRQAEDEGKGFVVITAHVGNWELVGHTAAVASRRKFYALAKPAASRFVTDLLFACRKALSINVLWTGTRSTLAEMVAVAHQGMGIGFVMDQKPDSRQGHACTFLGIPAKFVGGPALVVNKTGSPPIAVFCIRLGWNTYQIYSERMFAGIPLPSDQKFLTEAFAGKIGEMIQRFPHQWLWNYRRWRPEDLNAHSALPEVRG